MKRFVCLLLIFMLSGCSTIERNNSSEVLAVEQTKDFFNDYPEYLNSKELESKLFVKFQEVMNEPGNENLSMYQMLLTAHKRLQSQY